MASIYEQIASLCNLAAGWEKVSDNDAAAGVDCISVSDFSVNVHGRLLTLRGLLLERRYKPKPLLGFHKRKPDGSLRTLCIPSVSDRIVQASALRVLNPLLDPLFSGASYGYRRGISRLDAAYRIEEMRNAGYRYVVDADIEKFFDTVDHELLIMRCRDAIQDEETVRLIDAWVRSDAEFDGIRVKRYKGLPQGAVISPLLANLFLDTFDDTLEAKGHKLVRFADDFLILSKTRPQAEEALELSENILAALNLKLHAQKTRITSFDEGFRYLGYLFIRSMVMPSRKPVSGTKDVLLRAVQNMKDVLTKKASLPPGIGTAIHIKGASDGRRAPAPHYEETRESVTPALSYSPFLRTLYIREQGSVLMRENERLILQRGNDEIDSVASSKIEQIFIFGDCTITPAAMRFCLVKAAPIILLSNSGEYFGRISTTTKDFAAVQRLQLLRTFDAEFMLATAKAIVRARIMNAMRLLDRYGGASQALDYSMAASELKSIAQRLEAVHTIEEIKALKAAAEEYYYAAVGQVIIKQHLFCNFE